MGNDNLRRSQVALEAVVGTALPPTRQLVGALSLRNTPERVLREEYRASMGASNTYDDLSYKGEGTYAARCVTSELMYWLAAAIVGGVTPAVSGTGQLWTYTMPLTLAGTPAALTALQSLCLYAGDNTQALRAAGCYVDRLVIRGSDTGPWTVEVTFLTREVVATGAAFVTTLTIPANETVKNMLASIAIDAAGGTIGAGTVNGTAYGFVWTFDPAIAPDYTMGADPVSLALGLDMKDIQRDAPQATLELTTKWNGPIVTEYGFWRSLGKRLIRLENNGSVIGAGPERHRIRIDGCYVYTDFVPLDQPRDGTTRGRATLTAVEDTAGWNKKIEVSVLNNISAPLR